MTPWYRWDGESLLLWVQVQPKSSQDGFGETLEDAIKLRITAPPVDGKANAHLVKWLAKTFKVPKSAIRIEAGQTSRRKRLRIIAPGQLPSELAHILANRD